MAGFMKSRRGMNSLQRIVPFLAGIWLTSGLVQVTLPPHATEGRFHEVHALIRENARNNNTKYPVALAVEESNRMNQPPEESSPELNPVINSAQSVAVSSMGGVREEYQCAVEGGTCNCDGAVRFGKDGSWTSWVDSNVPSLTCSSDTLGVDFRASDSVSFGMNRVSRASKVCMCRPRKYVCAVSVLPSSKKDCVGSLCGLSTTCVCQGEVRFGYGDRWTDPMMVKGLTQCGNKKMLAMPDPIQTQDKVCQCSPSNLRQGTPYFDDLANSNVVHAMIAVILCYFLVYSWLAFVRTSSTLRGIRQAVGPSALEQILEAVASCCVFFAPMLCAIFLAVTKRASVLTLGFPQAYNMPPVWLRWVVAIAAGAFCCQAATYIVAEWSALKGIAAPGPEQATGGTPTVILQTAAQARVVRLWRTLCNVFTFVMYIALACILVGIVVMKEPAALTETVGHIPLHSGTTCTIILCCTYVLIYLFLHIYRTREGAGQAKGAPIYGLEVLKLAGVAANFAPMLSILFLGTQIAIDWNNDALSARWSMWMYICTGSVLLQVFLVIVGPYLANAEVQVIRLTGDVDFVTRNHCLFVFLGVLRWCALLVLYIGVAIIMRYLWFTNNVPVMTHQLYRLAAIYFATYLALWFSISARQIFQGGFERVIRILSMAIETVVFCPMLAAVFLAAFVRAHAVHRGDGSRGVPQGWVQDAMCVASVALFVQLVALICSGAASPTKGANFTDGSPSLVKASLICFNVAMIILYACVVLVIVGIFLITKTTATGSGAIFS
eukprot:TRINITY_DN2432_c0_g1_i1.p1 TRINITY_DN2432_c0_g1~~TRINITY_DN2432_c0_g1_i1.p1  ORF type:complete len:778 (+),score=85.98 TRINITY_DN2432_c0_g1_i1:139-2472(+)